jgi:hypothetical protein
MFLTSGIVSHHFFSWLVSLSHQSFHRKVLIPRKATSPVSGRQELKIHISLQKARPSELGELAVTVDWFHLKFSSPSGRHGGCPLCKVRTIWSFSLIPFVLNDILLPLEPYEARTSPVSQIVELVCYINKSYQISTCLAALPQQGHLNLKLAKIGWQGSAHHVSGRVRVSSSRELSVTSSVITLRHRETICKTYRLVELAYMSSQLTIRLQNNFFFAPFGLTILFRR